jgi:hypothetical protein
MLLSCVVVSAQAVLMREATRASRRASNIRGRATLTIVSVGREVVCLRWFVAAPPEVHHGTAKLSVQTLPI